MAITVTLDAGARVVKGDEVETRGSFNLGAYATDGIAVTAANVGLSVLEHMSIEVGGGYHFEYDKANGKIKAYDGSTEIADTTDITAYVPRFVAYGK